MPLDDELAQEQETGYDSNDPKQVRERRAAVGRKDARVRAQYRALLSHSDGRELLRDLLTMCGVNRTSFDQNPHFMSFKEGQRNVGLFVETHLKKADPSNYVKLLEEYRND